MTELSHQTHGSCNDTDRKGGRIAPVLLTVPEACETLRVSRWTLYSLIRSKRLATIKIGSRRCVPLSSIHALVRQLQDTEAA